MTRTGANEYRPEAVSPPGDTLVETLGVRGMTQANLAARTGRTPKLINEIIKGKAPITADTALQLERVLGVPAEFWNNRESQYREAVSRQDERRRFEEGQEWLSHFPIKEMVQLRWIRGCKDKVEELRELLNFFAVASPASWKRYWERLQVSFRKCDAFDTDVFALRAWLRKGEIVGQSADCAPFDSSKLRKTLVEILGLTTAEPRVFQPRLAELFASCGVAIAFVPELPRIRASGATQWLKPSKALIQVNLRYRTDDHFWFTVFHEAGHVLLDSKKMLFLDNAKFEGEYEDAANRFAAEQLLSRTALISLKESMRHLSRAAIVAFARKQGVAPGIVVGQLQHHGVLPYTHCNGLKRTLQWA